MAKNLNKLISNYKNLKSLVEKETDRIIMSKKKMIEIMLQNQLLKGENAKKKKIQLGYSTQYMKRRQRKGLQTQFVDLRFTEDFYKSIEMVKMQGVLEYAFISYIEYARFLENKYPFILELNKDNINVLIQKWIMPDLKRYLKKIL